MPGTRAVPERFAHIADLHFWQIVRDPLRLLNKRMLGNLTVILHRQHEFMMDRAEAYADAVAATGVSGVLLTGDFTSTSTDEEFEMAATFVRGLKSRGLAVYLVPGNHDCYTYESVRHGRFEYHFKGLLPTEGYPARVVMPRGTSLILVPTARPRLLTAKGHVSRETVETIEKLLDDCGSTVIVAGHYPLLGRTHAYISGPFHDMQNAGVLRKLLGNCGKRVLYVSGHVHSFSYVRDRKYPNMEHLCTDTFFRTKKESDIHGSFSEVCIQEGSFRVLRHIKRQQWEIDEVSARIRASGVRSK